MANIIDYVKKYGNDSFVKRPFCDVDSLILAELTYLLYDDYVAKLGENRHSTSLTRFTELDLEKMIVGTYAPLRNKILVEEMQKCKRFGKLKINFFVNDFEPEKDTQFSAITFILIPHKLNYVAYRGTDLTFTGWKEDFNMAIISETPSQKRSVVYLEEVAKLVKGDLIVGGHSKGGNLSYYASFFCTEKTQDRLIAVYNHDGPGFRENVADTPNFKRIASRLHKTVPHDSLVGVLLNYDDHYKIVKSNSLGLLQHDVFTWQVKGTDFLYKDKRAHNSLVMDKTLSDWLATADDEARAICIKEIFDLLTAGDSVAFADLKHNTLKKMTMMFKQFTTVDPKTKQILTLILTNLVHSWFKNAFKWPFSKSKKYESEEELLTNNIEEE